MKVSLLLSLVATSALVLAKPLGSFDSVQPNDSNTLGEALNLNKAAEKDDVHGKPIAEGDGKLSEDADFNQDAEENNNHEVMSLNESYKFQYINTYYINLG